MREIMERIAKSLEFIAEELKARRTDRQVMFQRISAMEEWLKGFQDDPFGLEQLKHEALSEKNSKQKG